LRERDVDRDFFKTDFRDTGREIFLPIFPFGSTHLPDNALHILFIASQSFLHLTIYY
jgi:hypothetical protein